MWVFPPGRDTRCADRGGFPGAILEVRGRRCSPDKNVYYVLDDYCINSAISVNSQEVHV